MKKLLPSLLSAVLIVALYGCSSEKNCKVQVGQGNTGTYQDPDGTQHQVTADDEGNVSVPCGDKDSLSMVQPTPSPDYFY